MKQVCIIGLGRFGTNLAEALAKTECEVLAIDDDEEKVSSIRDLVHHAVIADVRDFNQLSKVISPDLDEVILAFGGDRESSILGALHLKKLGLKSIRAKAYDTDHAHILKLIGVDEVIFPERDTAQRLAAKILMPNYLDFLPITEDFRVVELAVPKKFIDKTLAELEIRNKYKVMILGIKDGATNEVKFMPGANFKLLKNHILVVVGKIDDLKALSEAT
jgi:trk system potassium uptake protein TrkA